MAEKVDCVVIGAGVVGLAVARALALRGREVMVLEAEAAIGTGTSSRNSEVIHAGIYYEPGSAKARLCVAGRHLLYAYCEARGIEHRRYGKLIVAADQEQVGALEKIEATARANGVADLRWLTGAEARAMEPELSGVAALLSPSTGIVDSHGLMLALQGDIEGADGTVALRTPVKSGRCEPDAIYLEAGDEAPMELAASVVVNSAGLVAPDLARRIDGIPKREHSSIGLRQGQLLRAAGKGTVPPPRLSGSGARRAGRAPHARPGRPGQVRADVEWVEKLDFSVDPGRAERFYRAIRRYWPGLPQGALHPGYAGIRPKLSGPGAPAADFLIQGAAAHGVRGLVNLYGIESPGMTSALAIAELVADSVA